MTVIRKQYPEIVNEVEVQGYILDKMISSFIITSEYRCEIDIIPTRENRTRKLLERILSCSDLRAPFSFLEALERDYKHLADRLNTELREGSSQGEDVRGSFLLLSCNHNHFASLSVSNSRISYNIFQYLK